MDFRKESFSGCTEGERVSQTYAVKSKGYTIYALVRLLAMLCLFGAVVAVFVTQPLNISFMFATVVCIPLTVYAFKKFHDALTSNKCKIMSDGANLVYYVVKARKVIPLNEVYEFVPQKSLGVFSFGDIILRTKQGKIRVEGVDNVDKAITELKIYFK